MTKNRSMKIAVLVLALALLTSCFVGSTFAKYTSSGKGTATFQIANWSFTGIDIENETVTFDLDDTIVDTVDGNTDAHVAAGKIAPGTKGAGAITIKNTSDVVANLKFSLKAEDLAALNFLAFTYTVKIGDAEAVTKTAEELAQTGVDVAINETVTVTTNWVWEFNGNDVADTDLGVAGGSKSVEATVTLTQVD